MKKGFIYIAKNNAMPGLIKIGFTQKVPTIRVDELFTTGVPEPFDIEYYCLVDNAKSLEKIIHNKLEQYRNSKRREFFNADTNYVIDVIKNSCSPDHDWKKPNHEILAYSRYCVASEEEELENFVSLAKEHGIAKHIKEAFYDSNACICNFHLDNNIEDFSPVANQILQVALQTIGQFEWFGIIQHGNPKL